MFVRLFVGSLVRFFVRNSGTFVEFMSKFWLKFLWWCISHGIYAVRFIVFAFPFVGLYVSDR